jgi:hypothetical protein
MKHAELCAIAHNFADALSCGNGFVIGYYPADIYGEARRAFEGYLIVDFLAGMISGGPPSANLAAAILAYRDAFPRFCQKHGASVDDFREITVRYSAGVLKNQFTVTVEDTRGRRSSVEYDGLSGKRIKDLDRHNEVRPKIG